MSSASSPRHDSSLALLHAAFLLTGIFNAIGGALLPSLASAFHLSDSQSGTLFLCYFGGSALGPLLCIGRYARMMSLGFLLAALACVGIAASHGTLLQPIFFFLGIGVGVPMSAVSIFAGAKFGNQSAAPLTLLNFSWSAGALIAPLLAAHLLVSHTYRAVYLLLAVCAVCLAVVCGALLRDPQPHAAVRAPQPVLRNLGWIVLFAFLAFLEVGIENTTSTWLATYSLRTVEKGAAVAAATSSFYWIGYLGSRGLASIVLLRAQALHVLRAAVLIALAAASLLVGLTGPQERTAAMLVLGAALAPIFPLLLARFFAGADRATDSRWVLASCGFGGSVLPWITGLVSAHAHSLRVGLLVVPAALFLIACTLPALGSTRTQASAA